MSPSGGAGSGDNGENGAPADERTPFLTARLREHHILPAADSHPTKDDRAWVRYPANALYLTWRTLASNYVNALLAFVPLGIIAGAAGWDPTTVFVLNFLAIIPLASLLSFATEELSAKLGETLGGLLNASFGNAVELIVSIVALKGGEIRIVQSSMLGSILSNMLLVLGCCFVAGGIRGGMQDFNETVASTMSSLMLVASASLVIPATLYSIMARSADTPSKATNDNIMMLSRGTSIILLVLYVMYLVFQLKTHAHVFVAKKQQPNGGRQNVEDGLQPVIRAELVHARDEVHRQHGEPTEEEQANGDEDEEEHILGPVAAGAALVIVTLLVAVCAEYLVDSIDSIVASTGIRCVRTLQTRDQVRESAWW